MVRPTTSADASLSRSARSQRSKCVAERSRGHGSSRLLHEAPHRKLGKVEHFPLYTFRHTCLTRWVPFMDPWTLAYLAGHRDMSITKRYVHRQEFSTRAAIEKARAALAVERSGHNSGHTPILNTEPRIANLPLSS